MHETSRGSSDDDSLATKRLFRDVAADLVRRRDAAARGEALPTPGNDKATLETYRWREAALQNQKDLHDIMDWIDRALHSNTTYAGPQCLAGIRTKDQLAEYLTELLMPNIIEIVIGTIKGMNHGINQLAGQSGETGSGEEHTEEQPNAEEESGKITRNGWPSNHEKAIPF